MLDRRNCPGRQKQPRPQTQRRTEIRTGVLAFPRKRFGRTFKTTLCVDEEPQSWVCYLGGLPRAGLLAMTATRDSTWLEDVKTTHHAYAGCGTQGCSGVCSRGRRHVHYHHHEPHGRPDHHLRPITTATTVLPPSPQATTTGSKTGNEPTART